MSNGRAVRVPRKASNGAGSHPFNGVLPEAQVGRTKSRFSQLENKYGIAHSTAIAMFFRRDNLMIFLSLVLLAGFFVQGLYIYEIRSKGHRGRCAWWLLCMKQHSVHKNKPHGASHNTQYNACTQSAQHTAVW